MGGSSSASAGNGQTPRGDKDYNAATAIGVTPGGDVTPGAPGNNGGNGGVTTNLFVDGPNNHSNNATRPLPNGGLAATHARLPSQANASASSHHRKDKFKIVMLGGERVGKSAIFRRYITNQYIAEHIPTTRVDIGMKILQGLPHNMVLEIWDLPSSPAIVELMKDTYFDGADGAIIVADCAELVTFAQTEPLNKMLMDWQSKKRGGLPLIPVVFFANKCELTPDVKEADIKRKADREKLSGWLLTSCAKGHKIDQGFTMLLREMIAYEQRRVSVHQHDEDEKRGGGGMSTGNLIVTPPAGRAVGANGVADMGSLQGLGSGKQLAREATAASRIPQPSGTAAAASARPPMVISERKEHKISIPDDD